VVQIWVHMRATCGARGILALSVLRGTKYVYGCSPWCNQRLRRRNSLLGMRPLRVEDDRCDDENCCDFCDGDNRSDDANVGTDGCCSLSVPPSDELRHM
jgi:hypothetical protein